MGRAVWIMNSEAKKTEGFLCLRPFKIISVRCQTSILLKAFGDKGFKPAFAADFGA